LEQRSGVCEEAWTMQLDSNAREAKERLDQKLRNQRESVVKRYLQFFLRYESGDPSCIEFTLSVKVHTKLRVTETMFQKKKKLQRHLSEVMCQNMVFNHWQSPLWYFQNRSFTD
jgi:hypothetical protein